MAQKDIKPSNAWSILSYLYIRIHFFTHLASKLAFTLAPIPAYLPQYLSIRNQSSTSTTTTITGGIPSSLPDIELSDSKSRSQGFSPISVLILLMAHMIRLTYFWGIWVLMRMRNLTNDIIVLPKSLKMDVLGQSIIMVCIQLLILHAMVKKRRLEKKRHMEDVESFHHTVNGTRRCSRHNFWNWDRFQVYLEFLSGATICCFISCRMLLHQYGFAGVTILGQVSVVLESTLALPQIESNYRHKSTSGLSAIMVLGWVVGDCMKLLYFILGNSRIGSNSTMGGGSDMVTTTNTSTENEMYIWGSMCALLMDFMVLFQMFYMYPNEDVHRGKEMLRRMWSQGSRGKLLIRFGSGKNHQHIATK